MEAKTLSKMVAKTVKFDPDQYRQIKAQAVLHDMSTGEWIAQACSSVLEGQQPKRQPVEAPTKAIKS